MADDDLQLALSVCYELHYRSIEGVAESWEWEPSLLRFRAGLERAFERELVKQVDHMSVEVGASTSLQGLDRRAFEDGLRRIVEEDDGPSLSRWLERSGTLARFREFVLHRSIYQLMEADPHSWAIPRLTGRPKAAIVEIQHDEYGGGNADRMHASLFARTMRALGLDDSYGAYVDRIPGVTLATVNLMSLFGLHRRWRGALVGHLAAFEVSSPIPNRRYGNALRRLGLGPEATAFYDEHVEADAAHEAIAVHDLAGSLAVDEPDLAGDILFGAAAMVLLERRFAEHLLRSWEAGRTSLRDPRGVSLVA